jgi:hypothetical protein
MRQHYLIYGDERIPYRVFEKPSLTNRIAIHVYPDGSVQVDTPPSKAQQTIQQAVYKRARWIYNKLIKAQELNESALPRRYISGESHFYLGRRYQLKIMQSKKHPPQVKLIQGRFQVVTPDKKSTRTIKKLLDNWYREHAYEVFNRRMQAILRSSSGFKGNNPGIRLLEMKRQWGSCSPKGAIMLNPHLVKAPTECIDYVITHELLHLIEHNHSPRFYQLLSKIIPGWEPIKYKLDSMAPLLLTN